MRYELVRLNSIILKSYFLPPLCLPTRANMSESILLMSCVLDTRHKTLRVSTTALCRCHFRVHSAVCPVSFPFHLGASSLLSPLVYHSVSGHRSCSRLPLQFTGTGNGQRSELERIIAFVPPLVRVVSMGNALLVVDRRVGSVYSGGMRCSPCSDVQDENALDVNT